jgi:hypothetical protein
MPDALYIRVVFSIVSFVSFYLGDELPAAESDRMKRQVQNCFTHGLSCNVEWTALTCTDQKLYRVYIMLLGCNLAEKSTLTTMDFDNLDVARHIYGLFRPL